MKFAVICSAGGGAFFAAFDMLVKANRYSKNDFIVITDRFCNAEQEAKLRGVEHQRIVFESKEQFSIAVANLLTKKEVSIVLMLYSRLISSDLFLAFPTLNIHPALLPAFKGINAIGQAIDSRVKFIGATLHVATEKIDDGAIVTQVVSPIRFNASRNQLDKVSFLQKTYLILTALDCIQLDILRLTSGSLEINWNKEADFSSSANPCIQSKDIRNMFDAFQESSEVGKVIQ